MVDPAIVQVGAAEVFVQVEVEVLDQAVVTDQVEVIVQAEVIVMGITTGPVALIV